MSRREFAKSVKVEIIKRATRDNVIYCECCGLPTRRFHIDHKKADALETDKSRRLTADDGQLLCAGSRETCHGKKTAEEDVPAIAQAKRREARNLGIRKSPTLRGQGFPKFEKPSRIGRVRIEKLPLPPRRGFE